MAITQRHNAVLNCLAHAARAINVPARIEPAHLAPDDDRRPDIQLDLPDVTLLGDVTISHPLAKMWRKIASRDVEAIGDEREAEKNSLYADMAEAIDMSFSAFVLYTHGGFHRSALSFIKSMASAVDPATCLTSATQWRQDLMERIAIFVCYFVFDWWGISTATQIRLYTGLLSVLPLRGLGCRCMRTAL